MFSDLDVPYSVYELDKQPDGLEVQDVLDQMTGARTVSVAVFLSYIHDC